MFNQDFIQVNEDNLNYQDSGFMNVLANLTRTGIFMYSRTTPDGGIETIKQLRLPEEVEASMETLTGVPVTNTHPEELVSVENASEYVVGMTSERPKMVKLEDDATHDYVQQKLTIFDQDTIDQVQTGAKRELSLGYTLDLEETSGEWNGEQYDCIQRNIRYNHLSLVNKGRAGELCRIQLDGKDINLDGVSTDEVLSNNQSIGDDMKVINIDGTEYDEAKVKSLLAMVGTKSDELAKLKANLDEVSAKLDAVEEKSKADRTAKSVAKDEADFREAVRSRVVLEKTASKILGEEVALDAMTEREIKEKVIASASEVALDGKSDEYVAVRYDLVVEDAVKTVVEPTTMGASAMVKTENKDSRAVLKEAKENALKRLIEGAK